MIRQLLGGIVAEGLPASPPSRAIAPGDPLAASRAVLCSDPVDLMLCTEQCWDGYSPFAGPARRKSWTQGRFHRFARILASTASVPVWDHLASSYMLENTRAVQIFSRVVQRFRMGGTLGAPSAETQLWLDATEALLTGSDGRATSWLAASSPRPSPESVRRNAYWRMFGMELAFGTEENQRASYDRAEDANTGFVPLLEDLLTRLWRAADDPANSAAGRRTERNAVVAAARELQSILVSRREGQVLDRAELTASLVLGWVQLTLGSDTPLVLDLGARASSPAERLRLIGERVGLAAHAKSDAFFALSEDLSVLLRTIELDGSNPEIITGLCQPGPGLELARRVITEWSAATGKDLKDRARGSTS